MVLTQCLALLIVKVWQLCGMPAGALPWLHVVVLLVRRNLVFISSYIHIKHAILCLKVYA